MAFKYGELMRQFSFKTEVYGNARYEKYPEHAPIEVINHHTPFESNNILTRLELIDLDVMTRLGHEKQGREMQESGWNLQGIIHLNLYFHKTSALN